MNGRGWVVGAVVLVLAAVGAVVVRQVDGSDDRQAGAVVTATPSITPTPTQSTQRTASPSTPAAPTAAQTRAAQNRAVIQNSLYRVGRLPASRCKEPTGRPTTTANVRKYYTEFIRCLDKAWAPAIRKAGFTFQAPRLEVITGRSRTRCAVTDSAAYCSGVISMSANFDIENYRNTRRLWTRTTMAQLIAHEYGHHLQRLTGIRSASDARSHYLSGDARLAESRRLELQASCFAGVYLGADRLYFPVAGAWRQEWLWTIRNRGDEWNPTRSHGNRTSHSRWTRRGFAAAGPAGCNTFTASAASIA